MRTAFSDHRGFTLIEIIASLLLIGIISVAAGMGMVQVINGYAFAKQNTETLSKGQAAMARLVKEFETITSVSSVGTPTSLGFSNDSGIMKFEIDGTTIKLNNDVLTDGVKTCNLTYYDTFDYGSTLPQPHPLSGSILPSSVKIIGIELTLTGANNSDMVFEDRVFLRNLVN